MHKSFSFILYATNFNLCANLQSSELRYHAYN